MKVRLESLTALVLIAGCAAPAQQATEAPGVAFPMSFGEGDGEPEAASRTQSARASSSSTAPSKQSATEGRTPNLSTDRAAQHRVKYGSLPDPPPLSTKSQWELTLRYDKGQVSLGSAKQRELATPVSTTRHMGRFAFELWIGRELIDRVRFNFPLVTGGVQASRPGTASDPMPLDKDAQGATSTQTLLVPHSPRATRAVLVDRASGKETWLSWPPHRPSGPERAEISEAPPEKP